MTETKRKVAETSTYEVYAIYKQGKPRRLWEITENGYNMSESAVDDGIEFVGYEYVPKKEAS